jgi:tetratricopeptide (TPR) repeat protein
MQIIRFAIFALTALGFYLLPQCYAQSSKAHDEQVKRYVVLCDQHRRLLEYPEAIAAITAAIALSPNDAELYAQRERLYATTFVTDKALADANKAIALKPNFPDYIWHRGRLYYESGQYAKSLADFNASLRLEPKNGDHYFERARVYKKLEKYDLAINDYRTFLNFKHGHRSQDAANELGELYLKVGKPNEAIATFTQLISMFPDLPQGYYGRAKAYDMIGKTQSAASDRNEAQKIEKSY